MLKFKFFSATNIAKLETDMNDWGDANPTFDVQDIRIASIGIPDNISSLFPETSKERHIVIVLYTEPPE